MFRCAVWSSIIHIQLDTSNFCAAKDGTDAVLQMLDQDVDVIFGPFCSSGGLELVRVSMEHSTANFMSYTD